ncbi:hypothetical protein GSK51_004150 [Escherichia coli]|nr:hypothetical protein [Escherichia coli]
MVRDSLCGIHQGNTGLVAIMLACELKCLRATWRQEICRRIVVKADHTARPFSLIIPLSPVVCSGWGCVAY